MNLSRETTAQAIESGEVVPVTVGRTECVVLRKGVYEIQGP